MAKKHEKSNDMPVGGHIVRANIKRNIVVSPTFASIYANDTQIQTSAWDVRLVFGQVMGVDATKAVATVMQVGDVRMSPQHAKILVKMLTEQLAHYERTIGPIPQPKDV